MKQATTDNNSNLEQLGQKVEQLIKLCTSLNNSNRILIKENQKIKTERDALANKTNMVQDRVRKIISEIKNMEHQA